ncbi:glycosyltransferase [Erwinia sp. S38]|nr:glycosyltransferase [Erwinia sp. S38]
MNDDSLPTVSIVIPVYNVSKYVLQAVNSVINQTIKPFEIIIVDDGSTDESGDLIEKHYSGLDFVKIVHTENSGLGEARNVGTRIAQGDYIYYFDSDDLLEENLLEEFYNTIKKQSDMEIYAFSAESFPDEIARSDNGTKEWLPTYRRGMEKICSTGEEAFNLLSTNEVFFPNAWLYIFKRSLQVNNNLEFKRIIHEDEEFTPRLFFVADKVVITEKSFFRRRVRFGSIMQSTRSEKNIIGYIKSIDALGSLLSISNNQLTKKNLHRRIIRNIINIILILHDHNISLKGDALLEYKKIMNNYGNFLTRIARINFFLFRVVNFAAKRLNLA